MIVTGTSAAKRGTEGGTSRVAVDVFASRLGARAISQQAERSPAPASERPSHPGPQQQAACAEDGRQRAAADEATPSPNPAPIKLKTTQAFQCIQVISACMIPRAALGPSNRVPLFGVSGERVLGFSRPEGLPRGARER